MTEQADLGRRPSTERARLLDQLHWQQKLSQCRPHGPLTAALGIASPAPRSSTVSCRRDVPPATRARILAAGGGHPLLTYAILIAGFQVCLSKLTGEPASLIGSPSTVERSDPPNVVPILGCAAPETSFRMLVEAARATIVDAFEHQSCPFAWLNRAGAAQSEGVESKLIDVALALDGLHGPMIDVGQQLTLRVATASDGMWVAVSGPMLDGNPEIVEAVVDYWLQLVFVGLLQPETCLGQLDVCQADLFRAEESRFADTVRSVVEAAAQRPDAIAVSDRLGQLSYAELMRRAGGICGQLSSRGIGTDAVVGVCVERSVEWAVAVLGITLAGAAPLLLDPSDPPRRLAELAERARPAALVTEAPFSELFEGIGPVLQRETGWEGPLPQCWPVLSAPSERIGYVIYTSGSTGAAKAVEVPASGLANLVGWHLQAHRIDAGDRCSHLAGLGFDASVWELWPALAAGACVCFGPKRPDPAVVDWMAREAVTVAFLATPVLELVLAENGALPLSLRRLLTGGARLSSRPPAGASYVLANHYGPTETSVVGTWTPVASGIDAWGRMPDIGRPIANLQAYVLDEAMRPVPPVVAGELYLGGAGLARGYRGESDRTASRFVPNPLARDAGERLYRTGDRVHWDIRGRLWFRGRVDRQVKIDGVRLEPGAVEATLVRHPLVRRAAVVSVSRPDGPARLAAYVEPRAGARPVPQDLRAWLGERLPLAYVPASLQIVPMLPLAASGKVDHGALPAAVLSTAGPEPPQGALESLIARLWADILGVEAVGRHDNFLDIGGSSLLLTRLAAQLSRALQREVPLLAFYQAPNSAELASLLYDGGAPGVVDREDGRKTGERRRKAAHEHARRAAARQISGLAGPSKS